MTAWDPPPLPPRLVASRRVPLVGRHAELEALEETWAEVEAGRRQVVFLGGEPGAGKTRLVAEVAGALHEHGATALVGTSIPDAAIPYQPFTELLDHLLATVPEGGLAPAVAAAGPELGRLSRQVTRHGAQPLPAEGDAGDVRGHLFDAVTDFLRALSADRPLALVLDDVHWAQLPTIALLEHVVHTAPDTRMLVLVTFRTTAPDRSEEVAARLAELHRLEGVRRVDLHGLDTDAIAEYVSLRSGRPLADVRAPAALLRDRTGGNPFFLRELWVDLERHGGVDALRGSQAVPASIGDTVTARFAGLGQEVQRLLELAAVLGDSFELATVMAAGEADATTTMAFLDAAIAVGLVEAGDPTTGTYAFVHSLTRQAVLDRMPPSRRTQLHARVAQALERRPPSPSLVPRLAHHYLAAHLLGFHDEALRYSTEAGRLAEHSFAFEEAAVWFERAAALPECDGPVRAELLLEAGTASVRASHFPHARELFERLVLTEAPEVRLAAAMGYENATWRPGIVGTRAADLLTGALESCRLEQDDPRYVAALGSLGRALALAGETDRAREVGGRAIELARRLDDPVTLQHAITTSLWHGTAPAVSDLQLERTDEIHRMLRASGDYETLGSVVNFRATVSYLRGLPDELEEAVADALRAAHATGQAYYRHVACCLANAEAFLRADFATAERWTEETLRQEGALSDEMTDGPHGVQMFMIRRQTGELDRFRSFLDGSESFAGRWVPGLLALYTELGIEAGMTRTLHHLLDRDLGAHTRGAQWPMELAFMVEAALALEDADAVRTLVPHLAPFAGMNLVAGTLIATFGSTERYLARAAALLGDAAQAEEHFTTATAMDRHMRSAVHLAETLAEHARFVAATGDAGRAEALAAEARALAEPTGQGRVLRVLDAVAAPAAPAGLTPREVDVLRLLADGLSNQEIGDCLHISTNTAANHVRAILMKTGAANRTQAAVYAARNHLVRSD